MITISTLLTALTLFFYQNVMITAYTASPQECGNNNGITASGTNAEQGRTIASDHLPFGTKVEIDGHVYTVEDRFGGGHTNKIDIYFEDYSDAVSFGSQIKTVKIYY